MIDSGKSVVHGWLEQQVAADSREPIRMMARGVAMVCPLLHHRETCYTQSSTNIHGLILIHTHTFISVIQTASQSFLAHKRIVIVCSKSKVFISHLKIFGFDSNFLVQFCSLWKSTYIELAIYNIKTVYLITSVTIYFSFYFLAVFFPLKYLISKKTATKNHTPKANIRPKKNNNKKTATTIQQP